MVKLALLVGCNYSNNSDVPLENRLYGCITDVNAMNDLIRQRFGFQDNNITILTEEKGRKPPTASNITAALKRMVHAATGGDILLFYFSGGGAVPLDITRGNPVIVPCDLIPIAGTQILDIIIPLPATAIFVLVCDSSYSGGLFHENVQIQANVPDPVPNFGLKTIPSSILGLGNVTANLPADRPVPNNAILLSSSNENEESMEVRLNCVQSKAFSVYSSAIQELFNSPLAVNPPTGKTNGEVETFTTQSLANLGFDQHPRLIPIENNAAALFLGGYVA